MFLFTNTQHVHFQKCVLLGRYQLIKAMFDNFADTGLKAVLQLLRCMPKTNKQKQNKKLNTFFNIFSRTLKTFTNKFNNTLLYSTYRFPLQCRFSRGKMMHRIGTCQSVGSSRSTFNYYPSLYM